MHKMSAIWVKLVCYVSSYRHGLKWIMYDDVLVYLLVVAAVKLTQKGGNAPHIQGVGSCVTTYRKSKAYVINNSTPSELEF